jgi:hypothetical protein
LLFKGDMPLEEPDGGAQMEATPDTRDIDMVELYEQMLFQRAAQGIRPVLYVSCYTDLECSMLMLLDESEHEKAHGVQRPVARGAGYHVITN